jgi:dihydropteroate synthase
MLGVRRASALPPLTVRGKIFAWGVRTFVMGIINVTPDSFSGDGLGSDPKSAAERARAFVAAGCDIVDIGGESTRPGHVPVDDAEEAARVIPAIAAVRAAVDAPISIDTFKPAVAAAAIEAGADIINCVWGATPGVVEVAARTGVPLVVMHNRAAPDYEGDCVAEVIDSLALATLEARRAGIGKDRIIVDPGIGFGKTPDHNVEILSRLDDFARQLPYPLMIGTSRKSFIGKITGLPVEARAFGTAASVALAISAGADIVRVHDVESMMAVVDVADAICRTGKAISPRQLADLRSAATAELRSATTSDKRK